MILQYSLSFNKSTVTITDSAGMPMILTVQPPRLEELAAGRINVAQDIPDRFSHSVGDSLVDKAIFVKGLPIVPKINPLQHY